MPPANRTRKELNRIHGTTGAQDVDAEDQDRQLLVDDDGRAITKQANASGVIINPATEETALRIAVSGEIMDDWAEADRAKVNLIVGQAGVEGGAGATTAKTQRTATASDSPDAVSLAIIDDWDEADRAKVNPIVGQAGIEAGAGAATAKTTRIAIATDANAVNTGLLQPLTNVELRAAAVPVSGPITDAQMRATPVPVIGPLTDAELRASPVPVDTGLTTQLDGLTDAELRAAPVPVSTGLTPLTDAQLRAAAVAVSGPLTDAQLRASAVVVSGPLTDAQLRAVAVPVSGPLTDAQMRATPVPVTDAGVKAAIEPVSASGTLTAAGQAVTISDTRGHRWAHVVVVRQAGTNASFFIEQSHDGINWEALPQTATDGFEGNLGAGFSVISAVASMQAAVISAPRVRVRAFAVAAATSMAVSLYVSPAPGTHTRAILTHWGNNALADSSFPADAMTNGEPHPRVLAEALLYNGASWDRARGTIANGALVDVSRVQGTVAVSGPLTDAQLRALAVSVSGPLTDAQLRASAIPVSGPLTDAQLRASAVPVSGPLTDAQLRALAVLVHAGPLRPSQVTGRTPKKGFLDAQTADALLYTVTAGKVLYVTSLIFGMVNTSNGALGRVMLRDGTTVAGADLLPFLSPAAGAGVLASSVGNVTTPIALAEPLPITAGLFVDILAGTVTYTISFVGYEE